MGVREERVRDVRVGGDQRATADVQTALEVLARLLPSPLLVGDPTEIAQRAGGFLTGGEIVFGDRGVGPFQMALGEVEEGTRGCAAAPSSRFCRGTDHF